MFIVLEGLDGAGKSTQVSMIRNELKKRGIDSEYLHFPRFDAPIYGDLIARFLRGEFGSLESVNPYLVALLYAGDRQKASAQIEEWIAQGRAVILDRYVYSNIAYQCAKIDDAEDRKALRDWIFNLEYVENNIIKPDLSIFLDVPFNFTVTKLTEEREGDDRDYLKGEKDIHESSLSFQERVRRVYLEQESLDERFKIISCSNSEGNMSTPEEIFNKINNYIFK